MDSDDVVKFDQGGFDTGPTEETSTVEVQAVDHEAGSVVVGEPAEEQGPQVKLNRKMRRMVMSAIKRQQRRHDRSLHRQLKTMRREEGRVPWRPEKDPEAWVAEKLSLEPKEQVLEEHKTTFRKLAAGLDTAYAESEAG